MDIHERILKLSTILRDHEEQVLQERELQYAKPISQKKKEIWLASKYLFECSFCGILYKDDAIQRGHVIHHSRDNPLICSCGEGTQSDMHEFNIHIYEMQHVDGKKPNLPQLESMESIESSDSDSQRGIIGTADSSHQKEVPKVEEYPTSHQIEELKYKEGGYSGSQHGTNGFAANAGQPKEDPDSKAFTQSPQTEELKSKTCSDSGSQEGTRPAADAGQPKEDTGSHEFSQIPQAEGQEDSDSTDSAEEANAFKQMSPFKRPRNVGPSFRAKSLSFKPTLKLEAQEVHPQHLRRRPTSLPAKRLPLEGEEHEVTPQSDVRLPITCGCPIPGSDSCSVYKLKPPVDEIESISKERRAVWGEYKDLYECPHCEILYMCYSVFTCHKHAHTKGEPFLCTCGHNCKGDKYTFSNHYHSGKHILPREILI